MRVLFLIPGENVPSSQRRVLDHLARLEGGKLNWEVHALPRTLRERIPLLRAAGQFDLVFLQKKVLHAGEFLLLRAANRRLVFDFDDAIMYPAADPSRRRRISRWRARARFKNFARLTRGCRTVIAGNPFLQAEALRFTPRVHLLPTPIDTERFVFRPPRMGGRSTVVGWYGSPGNLPYLEGLRGVFRSLLQRYPEASLKVISQAPLDWPELDVAWKPWRKEEEVEDLGSFDVGIMPLGSDLWSRGKCGNKLLIYMARGMAVVGTDTEANRDVIDEGRNGFLVRSADQWLERLSLLIEDHQLRAEMGRAGREKVEQAYSYRVLSPRFQRILEEALDAGGALKIEN